MGQSHSNVQIQGTNREWYGKFARNLKADNQHFKENGVKIGRTANLNLRFK